MEKLEIDPALALLGEWLDCWRFWVERHPPQPAPWPNFLAQLAPGSPASAPPSGQDAP